MAANLDGLIVRRQAKDTLTAVELNKGQTLEFTLADGSVRHITLKATSAEVTETTLKKLMVEENAAVTNYRFACTLEIEGEEYRLERENSTQASFYKPWEIAGMRIWFDAVDDIFTFLTDTHGGCRPGKDARFGMQDAALGICPEKLHAWCPLPEGGLTIDLCYRGEDVWMGAYNGASAHGGLISIIRPARLCGRPLIWMSSFFSIRLRWAITITAGGACGAGITGPNGSYRRIT